jgi:cytochrome c553
MVSRKPARRWWTLPFAIAAMLWVQGAGGLGAADPVAERIQQCGTCHGEKGVSKMENTPSLAGQPALFLTNQLILMRERLRKSEIMAPFVVGLKDDEAVALAEHYAGLRPESSAEAVDASLVAAGKELAAKLRCGSCHLPGYEGREQMPRLAGQRLDYLVLSLTAYREGTRSGIDTSMNGIMYGVSDGEIRALAHYLAGLR